jgi:hypothetical protein
MFVNMCCVDSQITTLCYVMLYDVNVLRNVFILSFISILLHDVRKYVLLHIVLIRELCC